MGSAPTGENRIRDELWLKNMRDIGVRVEFLHQKWPDLLKMSRAGQLQMWQVGWTATSADSYMELGYGPSGGQTNLSFFKNAEYDELFRSEPASRTDAERDKLYARMTEIVAAYAPMGGGIYRIENTLAKPWIVGYKKDSFRSQPWRFIDVDLARLKAGQVNTGQTAHYKARHLSCKYLKWGLTLFRRGCRAPHPPRRMRAGITTPTRTTLMFLRPNRPPHVARFHGARRLSLVVANRRLCRSEVTAPTGFPPGSVAGIQASQHSRSIRIFRLRSFSQGKSWIVCNAGCARRFAGSGALRISGSSGSR